MTRLHVLVPTLRCPKCGKLVFDLDPDFGRAFLQCEKASCRQRWWWTTLSAGLVRPQIVHVIAGEDPSSDDVVRAEEIMRRDGLPERLSEPMFWQLPLTGHEYHLHRRQGRSTLRELFDRVFHPRSSRGDSDASR